MKLTNQQLKQIIKEELENVLSEEGSAPVDDARKSLAAAKQKLAQAQEVYKQAYEEVSKTVNKKYRNPETIEPYVKKNHPEVMKALAQAKEEVKTWTDQLAWEMEPEQRNRYKKWEKGGV